MNFILLVGYRRRSTIALIQEMSLNFGLVFKRVVWILDICDIFEDKEA